MRAVHDSIWGPTGSSLQTRYASEALLSDELWPRDWHLRITGFMRKALMLTVYLAMIAAGSWVTYDWVVFGGRGILFRAGGFLAVFGAYLLWIDFLSPNREQF